MTGLGRARGLNDVGNSNRGRVGESADEEQIGEEGLGQNVVARQNWHGAETYILFFSSL